MIAIYTRSLGRALPLLILASVIFGISSYLIASSLGPTYTVRYSYVVSLKSRDQVADYRFDGYYALQATDLFAATLAKWTTTPEVIVAALAQAGQPVDSAAASLIRKVRAEKIAPQLVTVAVNGRTAQGAQDLSRALQAVMRRNIARYHDQGIPAVGFEVITTDPWTGESPLQAVAIAAAAALAALFLGVNGVLLATSIKHWE